MGQSFVLLCTQQNKCTANNLKYAEHLMCQVELLGLESMTLYLSALCLE